MAFVPTNKASARNIAYTAFMVLPFPSLVLQAAENIQMGVSLLMRQLSNL